MATYSIEDPSVATGPRAPRYDGYPTAPHFSEAVTPDAHARWLQEIPAGPASLYVHIPFCSALCWFCTARAQGVSTAAPVRDYLAGLAREIAKVGALAAKGATITRMHWGGGSPSILTPLDAAALFARLRAAFAFAPDAEVTVEIDPRDADAARLDALAAGGLTRGALMVVDCDAAVQRAVNRRQNWAQIDAAAAGLRVRGAAVDADVLYGLPLQTEAGLRRTMERVAALAPDRVALCGYAHAPWIAQRQRAIQGHALPDADARRAQAALARTALIDAGYVPIGIDHFARPGDALAVAAAQNALRRGFQGYVADPSATQIGLGASAISRLPRGYVQNACGTARYQAAVAARGLASARGKALSLADKVRGHVIERLICTFAFDAEDLTDRFGDFARPCIDIAAALLTTDARAWLRADGRGGFSIRPEATMWTRLIASRFDAYIDAGDTRHCHVV